MEAAVSKKATKVETLEEKAARIRAKLEARALKLGHSLADAQGKMKRQAEADASALLDRLDDLLGDDDASDF
jgi:hypothetical protein